MKLSQKALVILAVAFILSVINVVKAECNLTVLKKTENAKTALLGTTRLSKKTLEELNKHCKINYKVMSKEHSIQLRIKKLQQKLANL